MADAEEKDEGVLDVSNRKYGKVKFPQKENENYQEYLFRLTIEEWKSIMEPIQNGLDRKSTRLNSSH